MAQLKDKTEASFLGPGFSSISLQINKHNDINLMPLM